MGLGARLAAVFAAVAAATALLVGSASYLSTDPLVTAEVDSFLRERVEEITDGQRDTPRGRNDRRNDVAPVVAVSPDSEVQVLNKAGEVTSNSGLLLPIDAIDQELAAEGGRRVLRTVDIDGTDYRMITTQLDNGGALQVARSLEESAGLLAALRARIVLVAVLVALVAAGLGWIVAQRTTRPLRKLSQAVDEVAETRDFTVPVPSLGNDEVGRLGRGFNRMLGAIEQSQEQQRRLVQDAAHELRTPLTSVTANIEWLIHAKDLDDETRGTTLAGVRRELGELNDVMAEIIELATDSHVAPQLVPTDLAAVAAGVVDRFIARSGREVVVQTVPATVVGDADSLDRAITNLLSNADKYSPDNASIGLTVGPGGVFVDDSGPGIPEADRELVFDRFYRRAEDRSKPGSGLGLSIVASIVEQHGGRVSVDESPMGGARVGFSVPVA